MLRARKTSPRMDFAVPAINIVFLLLLFFITSGSQVNRPELVVAAPSAQLLSSDRLPRPLLTVMDDGTLFLDGRETSEAALVRTIAESREGDPRAFATLNILADRGLTARSLLGLMDRIRGESTMVLKLVTERVAADRPRP